MFASGEFCSDYGIGLVTLTGISLNGFNHDEFLVFRVAGAAPEPATLALLLMGAVALLKRRG